MQAFPVRLTGSQSLFLSFLLLPPTKVHAHVLCLTIRILQALRGGGGAQSNASSALRSWKILRLASAIDDASHLFLVSGHSGVWLEPS